MAEAQNDSEKTEEPTSKKLEEAHKKGDVAKSQEVNAWFVMLGIAAVVGFMSDDFTRSLASTMRLYIAEPHLIPMDQEHLRTVWLGLGKGVLVALALPMLILVGSAVAGNLVQHRLVFTGEGLKPKWSKVSPVAGLERLFSAKSLVNFGKSLIKLVVVGVVTFLVVWPERDRLGLMMTYDLATILSLVQVLTFRMLVAVLAVMTVVAVIDYLFERQQWLQKQRMTVQEVKDEYKQMEGDPTVKARLRQVRIERGRKRMMAAVPTASVVIANPTHFAVALKYEQGMGAPVCVAKGVDLIALKIREIAEANGVPVVENPPLARTLHASVDLDQPIQPEHYKAVAEVIGYVMRLKSKLGGRSARR